MPDEDETKRTDDVAGAARPPAALDQVEPDGSAEDEPQDAPDGDADDEPAAEPLAPMPENVADLAGACVRFVAARYGTTLDYAPETLSLVDQWIRDARAEAKRRAGVVELVQSAAGAYLGEVIRRSFGGAWRADDPDLPSWRLCLSTVFCSFNPIGMAREAILLEEADGWHAHFEVDPGEREDVERRLEALPPLADADYYAPSTRFDVVEILVDGLRASMSSRGLDDVRFGPDDYR